MCKIEPEHFGLTCQAAAKIYGAHEKFIGYSAELLWMFCEAKGFVLIMTGGR